MCISSCESRQQAYEKAEYLFQHWQLKEASVLIDTQLKQALAPQEIWKFNLLKANVLFSQNNITEALAILNRKPAPEDRLLEATRLMLLGQIATLESDAPLARQMFDQSLTLARQSKSVETEAQIELRLSTLQMSENQLIEAEATVQQAIAKAVALGNDHLLGQCLGNIGVLMLKENRWSDAIYWLERALKIFEELGLKRDVAKATGNLGACYRKLGNLDQAEALLTKAEQGLKDVADFKSQQIWLNNLGGLLEDRGDHQGALSFFQRAFQITSNESKRADIIQNLAVAHIGLEKYVEAERFNEEARNLYKKLKTPSGMALHSFNAARIARGRKDFPLAEALYKAAQGAVDSEVQLETASGLVGLFVESNQPAKAAAAFEKAGGLAEERRTTMNGSSDRIFYFAKQRHLFEEYVDYLVAQGRTEQALAVADSGRARAMGDSLGNNSGNPIALSRATNRTILYYSLGTRESHLWVIQPSGIAVYPLPPENEICILVDEYRKFIDAVREPLDNTEGARAKLFQILLEPARKHTKYGSPLLIVPDTVLHSINFETLPSFGDHLFLIEDHELAVSPSLRTIRLQQTAPSSTRSLLVVGSPDQYPAPFKTLPNSAREVEYAAAAFPAGRVKQLLGTNASRAEYLKADAGNFNFLHFAIHATANSANPMDSALILKDDPKGYRVTANDIARQKLSAELVILSACRSAGAKAFSGEGLVGLSHAFLKAGAKRVIAGLWNVDDKAAADLFGDLYVGIKVGQSPGAALREAKLKMIHSDKYLRKPYYWGPWQLYVTTTQ